MTAPMSQSAENDVSFYEKHYPDWTVHELPLVVSVPMKDASRDAALALVREVLDEAALDIRVRVIPPGISDEGTTDE